MGALGLLVPWLMLVLRYDHSSSYLAVDIIGMVDRRSGSREPDLPLAKRPGHSALFTQRCVLAYAALVRVYSKCFALEFGLPQFSAVN